MFRSFRSFAVTVSLLLAVVVPATGCGGGDAEPLTVEEYGRAVCPYMGIEVGGEEPTWGDVVRAMEDVREQFEVTPPGALRAYHQANVALIDAMVDFAGEQPARGPVDPFELWMAAQPPAEKVEQVIENLQPELRAVLVEHGCGA